MHEDMWMELASFLLFIHWFNLVTSLLLLVYIVALF